MQKRNRGLFYVLAALLSLAACSPAPSEDGAAQIVTTMQQAISAAEVTSVRLTVSASDMSTRTVNLVRAGNQWSGVLGHLPVGTGRTFRGEAFDSGGTLLYAGDATGVAITAGQRVVVSLILQEVTPAVPFENAAPRVTSLVANSSTVDPGGSVTLRAMAQDLNAGDTLTYAWSTGSGSFSSPSSLSTSWTAPDTTGPVTLTLTVTDSKGAQVTVSLTITVRAPFGNAAANVSLNTWPQVTKVLATPTAVEVGQSTTATVTASDNDGDSLSYSWAASCPGTWTNASSANAAFTPTAQPTGDTCANCDLIVTVNDGKGGQNTGTLTICVGFKPAATYAPEIVETFQSAASTTANGTVTFRVRAVDPQNSSLSFFWQSNIGTLAPAANATDSSEVVWTAPSCVPTNTTPTVTATATSALGLSSSHSFSLTGLPGCSTNTWLQFVGGHGHNATLKGDGTVWAWGYNYHGQLGDGTNVDRIAPMQVQGLTGVTSIAAGAEHTMALKSDGTVWVWGGNSYGQLGIGTITNCTVPVQVPGLSGVTSIVAGPYNSVVFKSDGTVLAWGFNGFGQLGDGTTTDRSIPVQVQGLAGVTSITAGMYHIVALKSDGTVLAWGYNNVGQLGDGTTTDRSVPVQVQGLAGVTSIAAGQYHTVALKSDGTVLAWGYNAQGQLGNGSFTRNSTTPMRVQGLVGVISIAAGLTYTMSLKSDGTVWTWGRNDYGQLGDGTTTHRETPVQAHVFSTVTSIAAGLFHALVLTSDNTFWAWGTNVVGQLGDGTYTDRSTPVKVQGLQ